MHGLRGIKAARETVDAGVCAAPPRLHLGGAPVFMELGWTFLGIASVAGVGLVVQFVHRAW